MMKTHDHPYEITSTPEGEYKINAAKGGSYGPFKSLELAKEGLKLIINPDKHYFDEEGVEIIFGTEAPK